MKWNYDIEEAKTTRRFLICVDNEEQWIGFSSWIPSQGRWTSLAEGQSPLAWFDPTHPLKKTPAPVSLPFGMVV